MGPDARFDDLLADPRNFVRPPPPHVPIDKVRRAANAAMMGPPSIPIEHVEDLAVETEGRSIAMRLYRPSDNAGLPVIVFFHGGGWVWGNLETHDTICRELAQASGAAVIAVDYRLSPETRFPGQLDDGTDALRWISANAERLRLDGGRIALCGDSAGGNLAFSLAILAARDGLAVRHVAMLYPPLDAGCDSASQHELADGYVLTRDGMQWFWDCYLGDPKHASDPLAAPLAANGGDWSKLPPVTIVTAEFDILRDEGEMLATKLREAGVAAKHLRYDGMIHGFLSLPVAADAARRAISDVAREIVHAFDKAREANR